jgi:hypothetical protein
MGYPATPVRRLTPQELQRYDEDGVVMLRGAIDRNWLEMVEEGLEQARSDPSMIGRFMSRKVEGYKMDIFLWKRLDVLRDLIYYGPFAHWARDRCAHALAPGPQLLAHPRRADHLVLDSARPGEQGQQRPAVREGLAQVAAALQGPVSGLRCGHHR